MSRRQEFKKAMNDLDKAATKLKRAIASTWLMRQLLRNPVRSKMILIILIATIITIGAITK